MTSGHSSTAGHEYAYLDHDGPLAFAHRGGALHPDNQGLENSRAAFQTAIDLGYRYLETDVHVTRDGVVIAFHDETLDRTTTGTGVIADLPYAEVKEALIGGREPIATLGELFEAWPQARFNVDLKSVGAITPLVELLREHDAFDRVCVASFSESRIRRARALLGPTVATGLGPLAVAVLKFVPFRWLRARLLPPGVCAQIPLKAGPVELPTARFVRRAHDHGKHVHVWTVDDASTMHSLLDRGVDGLVTDRIDTLRDVLLERGQWKAAEA
ncbi:MAG: glycerophosphodiester phosphodiesterase [Propionibacteriales bacterium]|nr:glycerophosphodiester phosphodiesterase [Propionibacteriales bacterium]